MSNSPMSNSPPSPNEVLLAVFDAERKESLQHKQSILNSWDFAIAAFAAITAGVFAKNIARVQSEWLINWLIIVIVALLWLFVLLFIRQQRMESEKSMEVVRKIGKHLGLYEKDKYIPGQTVLPEDWSKPMQTFIGLSRGDGILVVTLLILVVVIIVIVWFI